MTTYNKLIASIVALQTAETVTKKLLGSLSRQLLAHTIKTEDVRPINMLLGNGENNKPVLTPMNFKIACKYFHSFLPFTSNWNDASEYVNASLGKRIPLKFAKKNKKAWDDKAEQVTAWLDDRKNNLWVWADENVVLDAKPTDWRKLLTNACTNAQEKGDLNIVDVLECVCASGIELTDMLLAIQMNAVPAEAEEEAHSAH